jgi:uncharacterized protein
VPRLGDKTFEQAPASCASPTATAAGRFGRASGGLPGGRAHPRRHRQADQGLIGEGGFLRSLKPEQFTDERFGVPTVRDILKELEKPGRDPRPEFKAAASPRASRTSRTSPGMVLEGVVTNVAAFGAFVDIGVHQDGLVHMSALSDGS